MKRTAIAVLILFAASLSANDVIRVVALRSDSPPVFRCGDRCRFRGAVPQAVRLRIFRGTTAQLAALGNHPGNVAAGCIVFDTTIVRPRRSRFDTSVLDLHFFFRPTWLAPNGRNGQYVFIVERDDHPNGPEIERNATLRLPSAVTRTYFTAGADVTVLAPAYRAPVRVAARGKNTGTEHIAMMIVEPALPATMPAIPAPPPTPTLAADRTDCVDVQIESDSNTIIRSAESRRPIRLGGPTRTAP